MRRMSFAEIPEVTVQDAIAHLEGGETVFVDIRDSSSFDASHVPGAVQLNERTAERFLKETPHDSKVVVYCYHGHSSLDATAFLIGQGFKDVASMSGGFTEWTGPRENG